MESELYHRKEMTHVKDKEEVSKMKHKKVSNDAETSASYK